MQVLSFLQWILLLEFIMTLWCIGNFLYTDYNQHAFQVTLKTLSETGTKSESIQEIIRFPVSKKSACSCQSLKKEGMEVYQLVEYLAADDLTSASERRKNEYEHCSKIFPVPKKSACSCQSLSKGGVQVHQLKDYLPADDLKSASERRKKEYEHYKKREQTNKIILAPSNSPLRYPIHGVQVIPLNTILLPGLQIDAFLPKYTVALEASLGTFDIQVNISGIPGVQINGRGEKHLDIITDDIRVLNLILANTTYTSTLYSIDSLDIVTFSMDRYLAHIPVSIRQPPIVHLHDPGRDGNISSLVTITTKTFLRYDKLRELIKSIRLYYPNIKVIVADDNEKPEKIEDPNVEQYIMPFAKGWFAGRNLAVSQVTTKYFLWVDDDFLFTENTKIEKLVDVLEGTDLDMVGGSVAGSHFSFKLIWEEGDDEGDCLHWQGGGYHPIEGFPNCVLTGGVVNFFLAHTERVLGVGFDPKLYRVAHTEFFIDGLGRLRVGSCSHVTVGHQKKEKPKDENLLKQSQKYDSFRQNTAQQRRTKLALLYFKNWLSCYTRH
ncbi:beta-1,4 N-acetylgalactosaminyltransferase 2-like isoform X3 [Aquarana catesbeiana]|uniref:beta-1,4 N-acetylgalactosaminyltransferase 2-like isoform X3 n=1 Tax=Aquarana catesbeiana TaxID=8400 RepID=UPI003CC9B3DB